MVCAPAAPRVQVLHVMEGRQREGTALSTYRSKTKPELRVADQDEPISIAEPPPALNENEADSRAPPWAKMVLGLGFLLTGLWSGVILWGIVKVVELAF
jgi:hypothetical protein